MLQRPSTGRAAHDATGSSLTFGGLGRLSLLLAALTVGAKAMGLLREVLIAGRFGATAETDAFYLAFSVTVALPMGLLVTIPQTLLPQYQALARAESSRAAELYGSALLITTMAMGALALTLFVAAEPLLRYLAPRFSAETLSQAVRWTRTMLPVIPLLGITSIVVSVAQARGHFVFVQIGVMMLNAGAILALLTSATAEGVGAASGGYLFGALAMTAMVMAYPLRERLLPALREESIRHASRLLLFAIVMVALANGGGYAVEIVERAFWVQLPDGQLSSLGYAQRLASLPHFVLAGSLVAILLPTLAACDRDDDAATLAAGLVRPFLFWIVVPGAALAAVGPPTVLVVYGGGALSPDAAALTARLLFALLPTLVLAVFRVTIDTLCFSRGRYGVPVAYGALRVLIILAIFPLVGPRFGGIGLALALGAIDLALLPLQLMVARRVLGLRLTGLWGFSARLATLAMGVAAVTATLFYTMESMLGVESRLGIGVLLALVSLVAAPCAIFGSRLLRLSETLGFGTLRGKTSLR